MQRHNDALNLPARIDRIKSELGCTQADVARLLTIKPSTLCGYLRGLQSCPEWVVLRLSFCEARLGFAPARAAAIYPMCLRHRLNVIARETVGRVEALMQRQRYLRRAAL